MSAANFLFQAILFFFFKLEIIVSCIFQGGKLLSKLSVPLHVQFFSIDVYRFYQITKATGATFLFKMARMYILR